MDFGEYYKDKDVVDSYDSLRNKGLKARIVRMLEREYVNILMGKARKQDILEIGVGTGFIAKLLIQKGNFQGMDISKEMLNKTALILGNVKLTEGSILNIKLKDKFDKIVTIRVISHFNKKDAITAIENISSRLKPNGEAIFNLENVSYTRRFLRKIRRWGSTLNYQYSQKEIKEICEEAGLELEKIIYLDHLFVLPLHLINKILFNSLDKFIFNVEIKLRNIKYSSNNSFILCKKP